MMTSLRMLLVVLSFLKVTILTAQHVPRAEKNPLASDVAAPREGKRTYENLCQICHGGDGRGGRGPALAAGNFQHGGEDWQLFRTIRQGIPGTQMPAFELPQEEIWQVVTYLRTLRGVLSEEPVTGDPVLGRRVFADKAACSACHQVNGQGGRVGPDLSTVGLWTSKALRNAILNPNQHQGREPNVVVAKTKTGQEIRGVRKNEDTFSLQLMDVNEQFHLLQKLELVEVKYEDKSLMPDNYERQLTPAELQNLIAYLKTLRVRVPTQVAAVPLEGGLAYERIRDSQREPENWLTYWGDYQGRHYSALKEITPENVKLLQARWAYQFSGGGALQATPLVIDGVMYTTSASGYIFALDASSGRLLWQYQHLVKSGQPNVNSNRGVALLGGRLFLTTVDAYLVALDAKTGRLLWQSEMADMSAGHGGTMAPLALKDKIIAGISGGEFGIRGFIDAYDPASGKRLWRFYSVPGPGEFGNDTWEGDSWKRGGGATWMTGTYDPALDLLYWGIGNPSPDLNGDVRKGDNLFTCSVVALDAATGKLRWHFQFSPHDTHDWDSNETPVLVDRPFRGQLRKLLLHADRNAFFYVLDRTTGKFLLGKPFARQTWAMGLDEKGRPIPASDAESSVEGQLHFPAMAGAANWQAPSYDPLTGWLYVTFREGGDRYFKEPAEYESGKAYWGGKTIPADQREWGGLKAIDPETGDIQWEYRFYLGTLSAGALATGGRVVFAACRDGNLMAFESRTGRLLWRYQTGSEISSSPMSYAVDGKQHIAISAGSVLYSFALPELD